MTSDEKLSIATAYDCGYQQGYDDGRSDEREHIANWLRSLDQEGGEINRFLPTTLANWIEEGMHMLSQKEQTK